MLWKNTKKDLAKGENKINKILFIKLIKFIVSTAQMNISDIGNDILFTILEYCMVEDILTFTTTSKAFYEKVKNDKIYTSTVMRFKECKRMGYLEYPVRHYLKRGNCAKAIEIAKVYGKSYLDYTLVKSIMYGHEEDIGEVMTAMKNLKYETLPAELEGHSTARDREKMHRVISLGVEKLIYSHALFSSVEIQGAKRIILGSIRTKHIPTILDALNNYARQMVDSGSLFDIIVMLALKGFDSKFIDTVVDIVLDCRTGVSRRLFDSGMGYTAQNVICNLVLYWNFKEAMVVIKTNFFKDRCNNLEFDIKRLSMLARSFKPKAMVTRHAYHISEEKWKECTSFLNEIRKAGLLDNVGICNEFYDIMGEKETAHVDEFVFALLSESKIICDKDFVRVRALRSALLNDPDEDSIYIFPGFGEVVADLAELLESKKLKRSMETSDIKEVFKFRKFE
jgi:hypothetical protein